MQRSKSVTKHASSSSMAGSQTARPVRLKPLALAIAMLLQAGGTQAQQPFSGAWFAGKGANQGTAATTGRLPNGQAIIAADNTLAQQQKANAQLQTSLSNLQLAARAIAVQQAAQQVARQSAIAAGSNVPEGLADKGLKVDTNSLTAGWLNASGPTQAQADGKTVVNVKQTADKAILNWETFNIGQNTTLQFDQQANWSVLNRINDPLARPSQIQGQIKADGTVMLVNRNGIVFSGSSQVNTRSLVAAAVGMSDAQFRKGIYGDVVGAAPVPTLANDLLVAASSYTHGQAEGDVKVEMGARLATRAPGSVTEGGGYVLLAGRKVDNAGEISTPSGQATLAAGDAFVIRKGAGSDSNQDASTRGNEVTPVFSDASLAGAIRNAGFVSAMGGDATLTGKQVGQQGVLLSSTSVTTRGTLHLLAAGSDGKVTLGAGGVNAIVLDDSGATALDVQRDALLKVSERSSEGLADRRDQSLVRIKSGGDIEFQGDSLTLATGGQVLADAVRRTQVSDGARLDVAGAVGVKVAMASNNVLVNVQGNEQRDAAASRDAKYLNNSDVWVDRRDLVLVPAGTNDYPTDRWYTAGGLLEVSGYLNTSGHSVGEWAAQGGSVIFGGGEVVTRAGSSINIAGGSFDVQTGLVKQTWLKGADGQMVRLSTAPGDASYTGLYKGYEQNHARWGANTTESFYNPLIGAQDRLENGYTVGRDAGRVVVATTSAVLEGDIDTSVFQGQRQQRARDAGQDGYAQGQTAVALGGQLAIGKLTPSFDTDSNRLRQTPEAVMTEVNIVRGVKPQAASVDLSDALPAAQQGQLSMDADWLNGLELGQLHVYARGGVHVDSAVTVANGGAIGLHANAVDVNAGLTARGGSIALGNVVTRIAAGAKKWADAPLLQVVPQGYAEAVKVAPGVHLDARGLWSNLESDPGLIAGLPYVNGGKVSLKSTGDITLAAGSVIDVSSGAALLETGKLNGGKGGDISVLTNVPQNGAPKASVLQLNGELRGYGVKGGGTLQIEHGGVVSIGGVAGSSDVLAAGQVAGLNLRLAQDYRVLAGETIPLDVNLTVQMLYPGQAAPQQARPMIAQPITTAAEWTVPPNTTVQLQNGRLAYAGTRLLAGSVLMTITNIDAGYVLPSAVFPNGIPISPISVRYEAGKMAATDLLLPGGTLIATGQMLARDVAVKPLLQLDTALFQTGFAKYAVSGHDGVVVREGARVEVNMPLLGAETAALHAARGGQDPAAVLEQWLPALYQEDARKASMGQRAGADLSLNAGSLEARSALLVGKDAVIKVDPGRSISLTGNAQITIDGRLEAASGKISILPGNLGNKDFPNLANGTATPTSIWIGSQAVLDVSGQGAQAIDARGQRYGKVGNGGTIEIGARHNLDALQIDAADAFVIVRPGAVLDASGAQLSLDLPGQPNTLVGGNGGTIALSSYNGILADGTLRAHAGAPGAAGGTLALNLETPNYGPTDHNTLFGSTVTDAVRVVRELVLAQEQGGSALAVDAKAGQDDAALVYGRARLGVDKVHAGGFDNLSLLANGLISIDGDVQLALAQSLRLTASGLGLAKGVLPDSNIGRQVSFKAPYVRLAGSSRLQLDSHIMPNPIRGSKNAGNGRGVLGVPSLAKDSAMRFDADLIDIAYEFNIGAQGDIIQNAGTPLQVLREGVDELVLRSSGDLRFYKAGALFSPGNVTLGAAQIYPGAGDSGKVVVGQRNGVNQWGALQVEFDPERSLTIERTGSATPAQPYSVFGSLSLAAATVKQGGVLRAPLGQIILGDEASGGNTIDVKLLPGSLTSVSANGLAMPYGGTVDGLSYVYANKDVLATGVGNGPLIALKGAAIDVQNGAVLDLSGGGTLTGAAFLSGRGGSTDARLHPLVQMKADGGFIMPGLATNPVYAIVPGAQAGHAPVLQENGASMPGVGREITIGAGVPGLAAGTYTLLPSTFALLPGAFRVELNGLAGATADGGATLAMRNGSYSTPAMMGVHGTAVRDSQPSQAIVTPAAVLRTYSQYNETGYTAFALAQAQRDGVPRPMLERDAKTLRLQFVAPTTIAWDDTPRLHFDGVSLYKPGEGGYGGAVVVGTGASGNNYELLGDGASPTKDYTGLSIHAGELNKIGAQRIGIGGMPTVAYQNYLGSTQGANVAGFTGAADNIVMRDGAVLKAAEVFLVTGSKHGGITLEQGASINTLGQGKAAWDSKDGYVYETSASVLGVSNGLLTMLAPVYSSDPDRGAGFIDIGACNASVCKGESQLLSEGSIAANTDRSFKLHDSVRYGTRNLVLGMGAINAGSEAELAAAAARHALPDGLGLNQGVLDRLLRGDTATGAPALESLSLTARDSFNFYGPVQLSTIDAASGKSSLSRLVLGTPAIYGYGGSDAVARIQTDQLVWNGAATLPGAVASGGAGTGSGRLQIDARKIELGYTADSRADTVHSQDRLVLGFAQVALNASESLTANHKGSLAVYQSQGAWDDASNAYRYSGGDVTISTALLTGAAGSVNNITAGGALKVGGVAGSAPVTPGNAALAGALGAEISLSGNSVLLDTAVLLPSGKLSVSAEHDVQLGDGAKLDLAGRKIDFFDTSKYSWGGDVLLDSHAGDVRQAAGSQIDLSAQNNRAGKLSAIALGAGAGTVDLQGKLLGGSSGKYDAGGTLVAFAAGGADIRGQHISDFTGLNQRLNTGKLVGSRSFQLKQGDLLLGDDIKAREVSVSVDGGRLDVAGRIDASGEQVGAIRLAARDGVTLQSAAVLDAHGTVLRTDSYGQVIEAPNRAVIDISATHGRLTLADGARMDVRSGDKGGNYASVELNARRLGGATGNDIDIDAAGSIRIDGARSVTVNGHWQYDDAPAGTDKTADGRPYQSVTQAYLEQKHGDSTAFMMQALGNADLMNNKLKGLRTYADAFHLRPGVEIVSAKPGGDLHLDGDIDLSGYRYASVNPHTQQTSRYGSGEAGSLLLRAGGKLNVYGSISDGFDTSVLPVTPDDAGWVLIHGRAPWGGDTVIPHGGLVTLDQGTYFVSGKTLNYALPMKPMSLAAGTLLATQVTLTKEMTLPAGSVLGGAVLNADGSVLQAAGTVLDKPLTLAVGMQLGKGARLPGAAQVAAMVWPAGVPLPFPNGPMQAVGSNWAAVNGVVLASPLTLDKGAVIPSETVVYLPGGAETVSLRPADAAGNQGRNFAVAPMLAAGSQSWSMRLVSGADTLAADTRALRPRSHGADLQLADVHYGMSFDKALVPGSGLPGQYVWGDDAGVFGYEPGTPIVLEEWGGEESVVDLNNAGLGVIVVKVADGTPAEYEDASKPARQQLYSVVRTGTGDLELLSGANFAMRSPYGVYTAGTQSASLGEQFNQKRGLATDGTLLGEKGKNFDFLVDGGSRSLYQAWYPEHGGNLLLRAQGDVMGDLIGAKSRNIRQDDVLGDVRPMIASANIGTWLWRQGTGSVVPGEQGVPTAWWINFGSYVPGMSEYTLFADAPHLTGFTGIGTLGGGNLLLEAGGNAGMLHGQADFSAMYVARSEGLNLTVGSTGRVAADGKLVLTGGGDLDVRIGGGLNPVNEVRSLPSGNMAEITPQTRFDVQRLDLNGTFTNLRGALRMETGSAGGLDLRFDRADAMDTRAYETYKATSSIAGGGPTLVPGDSGVRLDARGDLVLASVVDPGRVTQYHNGTPFNYQGKQLGGEGWSWFSLWTPGTAIDLFSAGGNLTPNNAWQTNIGDQAATDGRFVVPSILRAVAASGSLYYGNATLGNKDGGNQLVRSPYGVVLAPAPQGPQFAHPGTGQLELLAADSIYASGYAVTQSGADPATLPSPFHPGFAGVIGTTWYGSLMASNNHADGLMASILAGGNTPKGGTQAQRYPMFSLASPTAVEQAPEGQLPARFYALGGDVVGLRTGTIIGSNTDQAGLRYEAGGPVAIRAGRDITDAGTPQGAIETVPVEAAGWTTVANRADTSAPEKPEARTTTTGRGNLVLHRHADDVSVVSAGRDVRFSTFYVAGPGLLEVSAGRDLYMADKSELRSLGPVLNPGSGDRSSGASISVAAGMGAQGGDYAAFAARYLDPAKLADPAQSLASQPGRAAYSYAGQLTLGSWLRSQFGYAGDEQGAAAFLQGKQQELEQARQTAMAAGGTTTNRDLVREYGLQSQLHLVNWLSGRYGDKNGLGRHFDAATMDGRVFFAALPAEQQRVFLNNVYFAELKAAGREYNEVDGTRKGSYLRGRVAIATLFPATDAKGQKLSYKGDLTMFSSALYTESGITEITTKRAKPGVSYLSEKDWIAAGRPAYDVPYYRVLDAGIHTDFGGDINVMAPGGRILVGVDGGFTPGEGSGLLSQGSGDIQLYAQDSILLGQSRIFTTFGGNILAWSASGDINAGRGSKSTVVSTPQRRVYDSIGQVSLSPSTPTTGAGIATLNPIPEVSPGDIDLIAPLGTIDAGEAGIRVSGNVNLAALHLVNAENIQVQGKSTGMPAIVSVNVGALSNASAAASQAVSAAQDVLQRERAATRQAQPSLFTVKVLGFGNEQVDEGGVGKLKGGEPQASLYQPAGVVQVLGAGPLTAPQLQALTPNERRGLQP